MNGQPIHPWYCYSLATVNPSVLADLPPKSPLANQELVVTKLQELKENQAAAAMKQTSPAVVAVGAAAAGGDYHVMKIVQSNWAMKLCLVRTWNSAVPAMYPALQPWIQQQSQLNQRTWGPILRSSWTWAEVTAGGRAYTTQRTMGWLVCWQLGHTHHGLVTIGVYFWHLEAFLIKAKSAKSRQNQWISMIILIPNTSTKSWGLHLPILGCGWVWPWVYHRLSFAWLLIYPQPHL